MDRSKKTLFELIGGIVTLTLLELAIVTIIYIMNNVKINSIVCVWLSGVIGMFIGVAIAIHMYNTIAKALDYGQNDAEIIMKRGAMLRMLLLFTIIVLLICFFEKYIRLYMLFLSIMNLKIAAYLVPLIDKKINKEKTE